MKRNYVIWMAILLLSILPIFFDTIADHHGKQYPFIWSIYIIPKLLIMVMFPNWRAIILSGIFYSFLKYTVEYRQDTDIKYPEDIALLANSIVDWSIQLSIGYFRLKYDKLLKQVTKLTITDPLTGLYNRRYFDLYIERIVSLCKKQNDSLLLAMFDIDYFKAINDRYGHVCGDQALKHIVGDIRRYVRDEDSFIRMGGEEFSIIMPQTSLEQGKSIAELVRQAVEKSEFIYNNDRIPITISVGLTVYKGEQINEFIEKTDKALYWAKDKGRNQLVVFSEPQINLLFNKFH